MDRRNITWKQLVRYLSDECDADEYKSIKNWVELDPEHEKFILFIREIWNSPAEEKQDWDVKKAWSRFQAEYGEEFEKTPGLQEVSDGLKRIDYRQSHFLTRRTTVSWMYRWGSIAAAVGAIIMMIFLTYEPDVSKPAEQSMKEFHTDKGQRTYIRLSDGSRVVLNAGSKLSVPEVFSDQKRRIELSGEAYFEVSHDPQKPFVVHAENSVTQVLGTKFGVKAYPEGINTQVVVLEGEVALRSVNQSKGLGKKITRYQKGILNESGQAQISRVSNTAPYLGWTEGNLVFENNSIKEVSARLERWYDIQIKNSDPGILGLRFTGSFTAKQPLAEVLDAIVLSLDITYTKKDSAITFHYKNKH